MLPPPETVLRVLRRLEYGSQADAAAAFGLSAWTLRRAERGATVGPKARRKLEAAFGLPWRALMRDWVSGIFGELRESS
jgi:hypothetical protein